MAKLTKGYAFAYQVLGYLYWKNKGSKTSGGKEYVETLLPTYDDYLENYVYEKIWSECSPTEQSILQVLIRSESAKVAAVREELELSSGSMSVYRDRLAKKGIVDTSRYGYLGLKLPRFSVIAQAMAQEY